eukprot:6044082-Prymnesium_polylepis.1
MCVRHMSSTPKLVLPWASAPSCAATPFVLPRASEAWAVGPHWSSWNWQAVIVGKSTRYLPASLTSSSSLAASSSGTADSKKANCAATAACKNPSPRQELEDEVGQEQTSRGASLASAAPEATGMAGAAVVAVGSVTGVPIEASD